MIDNSNVLSPSTFVPAFATLIAALLGSLLGPLSAFTLQRREQERKIKADNISAGNRALFTLMTQFETLENIRKKFIDPVRAHPLRFVVMRSMLPDIKSEDFKFDMSSLTFFLKPHRQKDIQITLRETLHELFIAEQRFQTVIYALNQRTQLHIEQVQPRLNQARVSMYADTPDQIQMGEVTLSLSQDIDRILPSIELILGHALYQTLLQSTDNVIKIIDATQHSLLDTRDKLVKTLNQLFPNNSGDILDFRPNE